MDWDRVASELQPIACERRPARLQRFSRDYYWFSPVLREDLETVMGDLIASPRSEAELALLIGYCVRHRIYMTVRGGGTGNYGQSMPIEGGVIVDMSGLNRVLWSKDMVLRAQAGARLGALEQEANQDGWELRCHPSTIKAATVGGFVGGGSGGIGSINFGVLAEPGNVLGIKLMTIEEKPREIELRGAEVAKAMHAYGTTGIMTEVEIALAPRRCWSELIIGFSSLRSALDAGWAASSNDMLIKKDIGVLDARIAAHFDRLSSVLGGYEAIVVAIVDEQSVETFVQDMLGRGGQVAFDRATSSLPGILPLYEYCFNHATLHVLRHRPQDTYLQVGFPDAADTGFVVRMAELFGDEVLTHVEYVRFHGELRCSGLQIVAFRNRERLDEIIRIYRDYGCVIRNPHSYTLDRGPEHGVSPLHLGFKHEADPAGLLNPGKMPGYEPRLVA